MYIADSSVCLRQQLYARAQASPALARGNSILMTYICVGPANSTLVRKVRQLDQFSGTPVPCRATAERVPIETPSSSVDTCSLKSQSTASERRQNRE